MEKHRINQKTLVLNYLKKYGVITPLDAFLHIGTMKLATRISELKKEGHMFGSETIYYRSDKTNHVTHYKKYWLL